MRTFFVATVVGKSDNDSGYMVEVFTGGQVVTYGPMHFIAGTDRMYASEFDGGNAATTPPAPSDIRNPVAPDPYKSGDKVLIANYLYRDQFIIVGRYVDMHPEPYELIQVDTDGDGVTDLIERSYEDEIEEPTP